MHLDQFAQCHQLDQLLALGQPRSCQSTLPVARLEGYIHNLLPGSGAMQELQLLCRAAPDPQGRALCLLDTRASGVIWRQCQRCLQPMECTIDHAMQWQLLRAITADTPLGREPLVATDYQGIVLLFVHEILLSLPDIPRHDEKKCCVLPTAMAHNDALDFEGDRQNKQFLTLQRLLTKSKSGE